MQTEGDRLSERILKIVVKLIIAKQILSFNPSNFLLIKEDNRNYLKTLKQFTEEEKSIIKVFLQNQTDIAKTAMILERPYLFVLMDSRF